MGEGMSCENTAEVLAVDHLVLAAKRADFRDEDIAMLAGYAAQMRSLARWAYRSGWFGVKDPCHRLLLRWSLSREHRRAS